MMRPHVSGARVQHEYCPVWLLVTRSRSARVARTKPVQHRSTTETHCDAVQHFCQTALHISVSTPPPIPCARLQYPVLHPSERSSPSLPESRAVLRSLVLEPPASCRNMASEAQDGSHLLIADSVFVDEDGVPLGFVVGAGARDGAADTSFGADGNDVDADGAANAQGLSDSFLAAAVDVSQDALLLTADFRAVAAADGFVPSREEDGVAGMASSSSSSSAPASGTASLRSSALNPALSSGASIAPSQGPWSPADRSRGPQARAGAGPSNDDLDEFERLEREAARLHFHAATRASGAAPQAYVPSSPPRATASVRSSAAGSSISAVWQRASVASTSGVPGPAHAPAPAPPRPPPRRRRRPRPSTA
jgi:hypothetical protein